MIKPSKQLLLAYEEVLKEKKKKVAVFSYGRLNPPTIGHEKLINKIIEVAKEKGGDAYLFVSHKQNNKTDPLLLEEKLDIIKQFLAFQKNDINIGNIEETDDLLQKYINYLIETIDIDSSCGFSLLISQESLKTLSPKSIKTSTMLSPYSRDTGHTKL